MDCLQRQPLAPGADIVRDVARGAGGQPGDPGAPAWLGSYLSARVLVTPAVFLLSIANISDQHDGRPLEPDPYSSGGAVVRRVYSRRAV